VKIQLRGHKTNYFGIGARITVVAENEKGEEIVRHMQMSNGTGFGSAAYLAHIGLMNAMRIKEVRVYWPASQSTRSYSAVLNALNVLDENQTNSTQAGPGGLR
jgi:hypothetical protein